MLGAKVESILAATQLSSAVDVSALLSSEYDSEGETASSPMETSFDSPVGGSGRRRQLSPGAESDDEPSLAERGLGGQLQGALAQRGAEIEELERQHRRERRRDADTIQQLRADNEALQRQLSAARGRAAEELQAYRASVDAAQARSRAELDELGAQLVALQAEVPALRRKLAASKAEFGALVVDGPQYNLLRKCAEEELSVVEHVQMRVHEILDARAASHASRASGSAPSSSMGAPSAQLQVEVAAREALSARLSEANARCEQRAAEAEEARSECRQLRRQLEDATATPEGRARAELLVATERLQAATAAEEEARSKLSAARREAEGAQKVAADAETRVGFLLKDKEFLSVQVRALEERHAASEARLAKRDSAIAELKGELARANEQAVSSTRGQAEEYSLRLQQEMERWTAQARTAQGAASEAHSSALITQRDARELALADADKCAQRHAPRAAVAPCRAPRRTRVGARARACRGLGCGRWGADGGVRAVGLTVSLTMQLRPS